MEQIKTQVAIIGGGIIGTAIARELSRYQVDFFVIERNAEVGWGATKANSGIIHAGFHDKPDSVKAKFCLAGNKLYPNLCEELEVSYAQNGVMMVALSTEEKEILSKYYQQGIENGVENLRIVSAQEALELEPNLSKDVVAALVAPNGGIVTPFELATALMENAIDNGGQLLTDSAVQDIEVTRDGFIIYTPNTKIYAQKVINAAGVYSDQIARMIGDEYFSIRGRKGEEYLLDKPWGALVSHTIFPVPTPVSKGILVIPTCEGNLMIGPTGDDSLNLEDFQTSQDGLTRILAGATRMVPKIDPKQIICQFAGIRAASNRDDFIIEISPTTPGMIHLAGIESPGLTAAPAIAIEVMNLLRLAGLELCEKAVFSPHRRPVVQFHKLSREEQARQISEDPRHGRIVGRCESITEAEIIDAIERGARTVDGVKFRTRSGCGRCQGGFCQPNVIGVIAQELKIPVEQVRKNHKNSQQIGFAAKDLLKKEAKGHETVNL